MTCIGGITLYKLKRRSTGEYKIAMSARDIDLSTTAGATTVYATFDHGGAAECSASSDLTCTSTGARLKCRD